VQREKRYKQNADRPRSTVKESVKTAGLHEALQDQHCGHPVHGLVSPFEAHFVFAQQAVGFG
jgi:hypothetical protein